MSSSAKALFLLFILLTLMAVGHDIYIWQTSDGFPFAFAALGWISKTYIPDIQQIIVDMLGVDLFNTVITPVLRIPATFLAAGIAALIYIIDAIRRKIVMNHFHDKWSSKKFKSVNKP